MNKTKRSKPQPRTGAAKPAEVIVGDKSRVRGIVAIQNNGVDERGRVCGTNGIRWVVA